MPRRHQQKSHRDLNSRPLRVEHLEDRRLLAVATVDTELDVVDFADGVTSLREAIFAANTLVGSDTIEFDPSLAGKTILLTQGELELTESATINGLGEDLLTIDAQQQSRVLNISAVTGDFTIAGLTLTGGEAIELGPNRRGGAIYSFTVDHLTIDRSTITGNRAVAPWDGSSFPGSYGSGGGVFAKGPVSLIESTLSDNYALGFYAAGGGIRTSGQITITDSTVSGNQAQVDSLARVAFIRASARGGGVQAHEVTLTGSVVSGNRIDGFRSQGGGINAWNATEVIDSVISGNRATAARGDYYPTYDGDGYAEDPGGPAFGGGIYSNAVTLTNSAVTNNSTYGDISYGGGILSLEPLVTNSTLSGNSVRGRFAYGGGLFSWNGATVTQSTISDNHATSVARSARGGGMYTYGGTLSESTVTGNSVSGKYASSGGVDGLKVITNSIVAGNTAGGSSSDLFFRSLTLSNSLIGDNGSTSLVEAQTPDANGNLIGSAAGAGIIDPLLGPLQNNGGPTLTHALLPGSPAIDAGQPFELVTPAGVVSSTGATDFYPVENLINDSGLSTTPTEANYQTLLHAFADANTAWVTDQPGPVPSYYYDFSPAPVLTFDLGGTHELNALVVWGYLLTTVHNNEARSFTLEFSTDGGATFGNPLLLEHARTGGAQETLQFGQTVTADTVQITITDNHFGTPGAVGGGRVGLGELKFLSAPDVPLFDQRGAPFVRVFGGQIDIGAVEQQPLGADFDSDGDADGRDFLFWQRGFGTPIPDALPSDGDADGDTDVDGDDRALWEAEFGLQEPMELPSLVVTTELDVVDAFDGLTSLREAIEYSNGLPGANTINFDPSLSGETILLTNGELDITDDVAVDGLGEGLLSIDAQQLSRVFLIDDGDVGNQIVVSLNGLTITGGLSPDHGGGILSREDLTVENSTITGNQAANGLNDLGTSGSHGGGIWAQGTTTIIGTSITGNFAGNGGDGQYIPGNSYPGGAGGDGGGVFASGNTTISHSIISGNFAGDGGDSGYSYPSGTGGDGGGIRANGTLSIDHSTITGNASGSGGSPGYYGGGSSGGDGGGISLTGTLLLAQSTVSGNDTGAGGSVGYGAGGRGGDGGGIAVAGFATIVDSTISGNTTGTGGSGGYASGGAGAGVRLDGGGTKSIVNSTITGNITGRGGGDGRRSYAGNGGDGGGISLSGTGELTVAHSTITGNATGVNGPPGGGLGYGGGYLGDGGGVFASAASPPVTMSNTIVAGNLRGATLPIPGDDDLQSPGTFDVSDSSVGVDTGATIIDSGGNQIGVAGSPIDPQLALLADNGGPTFTHALLPGSPAIDMGDPSIVFDANEFDQRGAPFVRVVGGRIDIGAIEVQLPAAASMGVGAATADIDAALIDLAVAVSLPATASGAATSSAPSREILGVDVPRQVAFAQLAATPASTANDFGEIAVSRELDHQSTDAALSLDDELVSTLL